jgi:type IV secretory pathway component VirB8
MQIVAKVTISNSNFEDWSAFFDGYKDKRSEFVQNEIIEKINDNEARVTFEITDLEGLTHLSSSKEITSKEAELGVVTEIL